MMDHPTIIEGIVLVLGLLCLSPLYAWFWRERRELEPLPETPARKPNCVWTQRAGHVFVVVYYDHQLSEAITALGNIAVSSRTPLNLTDADRLAEAMRERA